MPKYQLGGFNRITWIGATLVALSILNLILFAVGIRIRFVELLSVMLLDVPRPFGELIVAAVGALMMGVGFWIDRQDQKRLLEAKYGKRSDERNEA